MNSLWNNNFNNIWNFNKSSTIQRKFASQTNEKNNNDFVREAVPRGIQFDTSEKRVRILSRRILSGISIVALVGIAYFLVTQEKKENPAFKDSLPGLEGKDPDSIAEKNKK